MQCHKCDVELTPENQCCDGGTCCKGCHDCTPGEACEPGCNCTTDSTEKTAV